MVWVGVKESVCSEGAERLKTSAKGSETWTCEKMKQPERIELRVMLLDTSAHSRIATWSVTIFSGVTANVVNAYFWSPVQSIKTRIFFW